MPHTKTYDVVRIENRRGGHSEHLGTVEAATLELAQDRAAAYYECPPQCSLVVTDAESDEPPKSTHTPGPWDRIAESIEDANGNSIAMVTGGSGCQYIDDELNAECLANARLIASAPVLLEALEKMTKLASLVTVGMVVAAGDEYIDAAGLNPWCVNEGASPGDRVSTETAKAAIAAARGN